MRKAREAGIEIIAITDHNSMANCRVYEKAAQEFDIVFIYGVEIQSAEDIHIVALFDDWNEAGKFNQKLYKSLLPLNNDTNYYGNQIVINENEKIVRVINKALVNSSIWTLETVIRNVNKHKGFAFPAHVNVKSHSIIGQLGFIPENLGILALGITANCDENQLVDQHPFLKDYALIKNSDAHCLQDIGSGFSEFYLKNPTLPEIIDAIASRKVKIDLKDIKK
jgi:hypothetical protein